MTVTVLRIPVNLIGKEEESYSVGISLMLNSNLKNILL
jgi:hypothetical protein